MFQTDFPSWLLTFPPPLRRGDTIAVVSPSSPANTDILEKGIEKLREHYNIFVEDSSESQHKGYLAGSDKYRANQLQRAFDDDSIRAVIAARGGYGCSRIIDRLDYNRLLSSPKWIVGSSDITALLTHLYANYRLCSIHGPTVSGLSEVCSEDFDLLTTLLESEQIGKPYRQYNLEGILPGIVAGPFIGGNLTVLAHMTGTISKDFARGAILFLEDVGEKPYRLDRCLTQLHRSGILDGIKGIVFGDFTDCAPNLDNIHAQDVIQEFAMLLNIPAAFGYPAAHGLRNVPFVFGMKAHLEVDDNNAKLALKY